MKQTTIQLLYKLQKDISTLEESSSPKNFFFYKSQ